jgi:hypothetical protein
MYQNRTKKNQSKSRTELRLKRLKNIDVKIISGRQTSTSDKMDNEHGEIEILA